MTNVRRSIVPFCNEQDAIPAFFEELHDALANDPCEVIAVDDGRSDRTCELLTAQAATLPQLRVLRLFRNFRHQVASWPASTRPPGWRG